MIRLLSLFLLAPSLCHASYKLNPYTNQKDYYESAVEQNYNSVSATVTLQGNTFNGANQLLKANASGDLPVANLPADGYAGTYINVGEGIPGSQIDTSTITSAIALKVSKSGDTMTGNLIVGASVQANIFQGDGSGLTSVSVDLSTVAAAINSGLAPVNAALSTGVYTTQFYSDPSWITALATSKINLSTVTAYAYAQRDNLGNHTATQSLDLDFNNIANVNRIGVGNVIVDYSGSVIEYTRTPTFPLDVLGNSAIQQGSQIYAKELISLSSSSTLSPYIVETSVDCSGTGVCGISNAAGIASENGSYWGFYGGAGDSVILSIRYAGFSVPNGSSIIGAEGYIKKYSNNPTSLTGTICKMFYPTASTEIGINQCVNNDWSLTASTSVYGNSGYSWGVNLTTTQVNSDDFGWGLHISLSGNATAYIDVAKMRLFYASDPIFKAGYSDQSLTLDYNGESALYVSTYSSVGIMKQPAPPYELDVNGDINFSGSLYQNGVEFVGGGGGGDNLGSHIATQTLVMNGFSIESSSSIRANEFFGDGSKLIDVSVDLSTITSALAGKLTAPATFYIVKPGEYLVAPATFTMTTNVQGGNSWVEQNFYSFTNGSNVTFNLSQEPVPNSLRLSKNGVVQVAPADYSLSGQVITMVSAPASSTTLLANYAVTLATDIAAIRIDGGPIGSIIQHSTTTPPSGYLYCDGSAVSRTTYADLFAVSSCTYGCAAPTTFNVPDLRGMFLRGLDTTGTIDSEARVIGSTQTDTMQGHIHGNPTDGGGAGAYRLTASATGATAMNTGVLATGNPFSDGINGTPRISTETRPKNIAVAYHIKYAHTGTASVSLATTSVILATNNTFTGPQTFTGSVTVSSLTAMGNVSFNIPSGSSVTWTCPTAFTSIQSQGRQLGCIQTAEEGSSDYYTALQVCFAKHGGRLPFFSEIKTAFVNYVLTDETDDAEKTNEVSYFGTDPRNGVISTGGAIDVGAATTSAAYRCWIPR